MTNAGLGIGLLQAALLAVVPGAVTAGAFESFNVEMVSNLALTPATDIHSEGDLVYLGRGPQGVSIIDVSTADDPMLVTTWVHPDVPINVQDVRALNGDVWLSNETGNTFGVVGLDLTVPSNPIVLAELGPESEFPQNVHNMWPAGNLLYLSGYGTFKGNTIVDLTIPVAPELVTRLDPSIGIHDVSVVGNEWYIAGGVDSVYVFDVTDPADPMRLHAFASHNDTTFYQHNAYPIRSTGYVVVTEEVGILPFVPFVQGSVRVWDLNGPSPVQVWRWQSEAARSDPNISPHNAYVIGDFMYLSAYQDGVKIFDVTDPADPVEVAFFDTYPALPLAIFEGCWGVDPFQGDDRIFASDRATGFFHLAFNGARRSRLTGVVRDADTMDPIPAALVEDLSAQRSFVAGAGGGFIEDTGSGSHTYEITAEGYESLVDSLLLSDDGSVEHTFRLVPVLVSTPVPPEPIAPVRLHPARPNPFNPRTEFSFDVSGSLEDQPISIRVFDALGRHVRTLLGGLARAGSGTVTWDGRSDAGFPMPSGVYHARLRVGGVLDDQKLVLSR